MDDQNKNLVIAMALSAMVFIVWMVFFPPPEPRQQTVTDTTNGGIGQVDDIDLAAAPDTAGTDDVEQPEPVEETEGHSAQRISINTPTLSGSISLLGGRIDELLLKNYRETLEPDSPIVTLLSPSESEHAYYALFGWAPGGELDADDVPGANTIWNVRSGTELTPETPLSLVWENNSGLTFQRDISVDRKSMFTIAQSVKNNSGSQAVLAPYGILARHGEPQDLKNFFILHEGAIQIIDGELKETDYDDFDPAGQHRDIVVQEDGWTGFTDHYWMTTLIPSDGPGTKISTFMDPRREIYQTTAKQRTRTVSTGETAIVETRLFAGAKEWETIRNYQNDSGVHKFLDSIDWGWFFFLTKPIFALLHWLNVEIGNMGWAIIALTLIIKAILMPLAYKSYVSMAKMKELQPEMEKIKEIVGDDRKKLQQEMMALYKKEKVNPASGCLPILLQIPIFFSLYKVIFVTLEVRHAPWVGWIKDLSMPDPSSIYNLWGILPWAGPEPGSIMALAFIGILPLLLGISMWLQQKLNPAPTDPTQQMIFAWLPWVFMFMLGSFASGLVIYWIANNTITFIQQYIIMRSQGYKPDILGNIIAGFRKKTKVKDK
ncbi:MAG: membrane protein insertase YidC [Roseovarius sp.]|nr:membrane protein insertase YidC [Roseovarius sp.]MCY4317446.1 membrane protein insertase YidC [Roseovarius sp.]